MAARLTHPPNPYSIVACPLHRCLVMRDADGHLLDSCAGCETEAAAAEQHITRRAA